jgi:hypothetical protein
VKVECRHGSDEARQGGDTDIAWMDVMEWVVDLECWSLGV